MQTRFLLLLYLQPGGTDRTQTQATAGGRLAIVISMANPVLAKINIVRRPCGRARLCVQGTIPGFWRPLSSLSRGMGLPSDFSDKLGTDSSLPGMALPHWAWGDCIHEDVFSRVPPPKKGERNYNKA